MALTDRALAIRDRPDFPQRKDIATSAPGIRWKTGTSQGRRDAWSIGYDDRFTVLVWLGNLDRAPSAALTGADSAAPLMFEILEALRTSSPRLARRTTDPLAELVEVEICAFSGERASPFCPLTKQAWGVQGHIPVHTCRYHRQILRDIDSGLRVLRWCDQGLRAELASVLDLPSSVLRWMHTPRDQTLLPVFHPQCQYVPVEGGALEILSPVKDGRYLLLPSLGQDAVYVPLELRVSGVSDVSCILNGKQLGFAQLEFGPVLQLGRGRYHLFCSHIAGASHDVHFEVVAPTTLPHLPR
ncbi:MAG: hypothetical protein HYZ81_08820 [Nitrospinae bacterium]|nr:hypothetical protein [Nitrospinota bacterium]